jgi:hypothetical protein
MVPKGLRTNPSMPRTKHFCNNDRLPLTLSGELVAWPCVPDDIMADPLSDDELYSLGRGVKSPQQTLYIFGLKRTNIFTIFNLCQKQQRSMQ